MRKHCGNEHTNRRKTGTTDILPLLSKRYFQCFKVFTYLQ